MTQFHSHFKNKSDLPKSSPTLPSATDKAIQQPIFLQYWDHCAHFHCWNLLPKYSHPLEEQEDFPNIFCNNIKRTTQIVPFFFFKLLVNNQKVQICFFFSSGRHSTSPTAPQTTKGFQPMENYNNGATEQEQHVESHLLSQLFLFLVVQDEAVTAKNQIRQTVWLWHIHDYWLMFTGGSGV